MGCAPICDTIISFLRKFFSLIIAALMALMTLLYVIGAGRILTLDKSFSKAGFAHFLAMLFSIVTVICYLVLHFVPRKAYRLLYALTFLLILTMFLVGHSMGLTAPVVTDCTSLSDLSWGHFNDIAHGGSSEGENNTIRVGSLGQPVWHCTENQMTFATAFLLLILQVIALFDVQTVLLARVKSKTYGERFVEMGISN